MAQYNSTHTGQQIDAAVTLVNTCTDTDSSTGNVPSSNNKLATMAAVNSVLPTPTASDEGKYLKVIEDSSGYNWDVGIPDSADIPYDNSESGLEATNLQDAIDEAIERVPDGLSIASYGNSTFDEVLDYYNRNVIVYCKAGSGSNPKTAPQTRMAFLAYVNINSSTQIVQEFEFQYYRSLSAHSATNQGDEVYIYKLNRTTGWSYTKRNAYSRIVSTDESISVEWSSTDGGQLNLTTPVTQTWVTTQIDNAISDAIASSY